MTERTFREFKSWDEVSPGDTLLWIVNGRYQGTAAVFISIEGALPLLTAKCIEVPDEDDEDPDDYSDTGWATNIHPDNTYVGGSLGWALEGYATFKYDPTQQPEDDSI